ncbi:MAG: hypothetical protein ACK5P5_07080 [Pseudobdellovibrionaceae bacterium]
MASQGFFLILFLVIVVFAIWYSISLKNRNRKESMLDIGAGSRDLHKEMKFWTEKAQDKSFQTPEVKDLAKSLKYEISQVRDHRSSGSKLSAKPSAESALFGEKSLNVHFIYNSHTWDAYEVLGIPAGSSLRSVTQHYQTLLIKADPQSRIFLDAAYQAILKKA